jgi:hypothetical protein
VAVFDETISARAEEKQLLRVEEKWAIIKFDVIQATAWPPKYYYP